MAYAEPLSAAVSRSATPCCAVRADATRAHRQFAATAADRSAAAHL